MSTTISTFLAQYQRVSALPSAKRIDVWTSGNVLGIDLRVKQIRRYVLTTDLVQVTMLPLSQFNSYWELLQHVNQYRKNPKPELLSAINAEFALASEGWETDSQQIQGRLFLGLAGLPLTRSLAVMQESAEAVQSGPQLNCLSQAITQLRNQPRQWKNFVGGTAGMGSGSAINPLPLLVKAIKKEQATGVKQVYLGSGGPYMDFGMRNNEVAIFGRMEVLTLQRISV